MSVMNVLFVLKNIQTEESQLSAKTVQSVTKDFAKNVRVGVNASLNFSKITSEDVHLVKALVIRSKSSD